MKNLILTAVIVICFYSGSKCQGRMSMEDRVKEMKAALLYQTARL